MQTDTLSQGLVPDLSDTKPLIQMVRRSVGHVIRNGSRSLASATLKVMPRRSIHPGPLAGPLGRIGTLEVRLAQTADEIRQAQKLRYDVFFKELSATPSLMGRLARRDADRFDAICDHLLVIDHAVSKTAHEHGPRIVGTYRLLRHDIAARHGGFYSESEFDLGPILKARPGTRFVELGRSCVLKPYRDKRTVELLWHGIWTYVRRHRIDAMFGCASFEGTDPEALALPLSFLHHNALAAPDWRGRALAHRRIVSSLLPRDAINPKQALQALPPLIKGYLRVGATVGDGAVVDRQFGTTDVLVVLPVSEINPRYIGHFGADAERHAA